MAVYFYLVIVFIVIAIALLWTSNIVQDNIRKRTKDRYKETLTASRDNVRVYTGNGAEHVITRILRKGVGLRTLDLQTTEWPIRDVTIDDIKDSEMKIDFDLLMETGEGKIRIVRENVNTERLNGGIINQVHTVPELELMQREAMTQVADKDGEIARLKANTQEEIDKAVKNLRDMNDSKWGNKT